MKSSSVEIRNSEGVMTSAVSVKLVLEAFFGHRVRSHLHMGGIEFGYVAVRGPGESISESLDRIASSDFEVPDFSVALAVAMKEHDALLDQSV